MLYNLKPPQEWVALCFVDEKNCMKIILKVSCLLLALAVVAGCSNNGGGGKSRKNGTAIFFHNIEDAPELQLNAVDHKDRNGYGTVKFETFSSGVSLKPKTWNLEVEDEQGTTDSTDDEVLLQDQQFTIQSKKSNLIVFTGVYDTDKPEEADIQMHTFEIAEDSEKDDDDEELVQFINVSHAHKDLGPLDIYLVHESQGTDNLDLLTPVGTIAFGESTAEDIRLERLRTQQPDYYLRIALASNPGVEIYNSGERGLDDRERQTILISPNLSDVGSSSIVAFYYGSGYVEKWFDKDDNIGALRVFNGLFDSTQLDVEADHIVNDSYDRALGQDLAFGDVSSYVTNMVAEVDTYTIKALEGLTPVSTQIPVDIDSAEYWTVVFYGRVADAAGIPVKELQNASGSQASITFTNAAYFEDDEDSRDYNIHIKKANDNLNSFSVDISALSPGTYSNIVKPKGSYQIYVTTTNNQNIIDSLSIDLLPNTNYHFVIVEDAASFSGYAIQQL